MKKRGISLVFLSLSFFLGGCHSGFASSVSDNVSTSVSGDSSSVQAPGNHSGGGAGGNGGGGGNQTGSATYGAVKEISSTSTETNKTYSSTGSDESAILCKTASVTGTISMLNFNHPA